MTKRVPVCPACISASGVVSYEWDEETDEWMPNIRSASVESILCDDCDEDCESPDFIEVEDEDEER